MPVVVNKEQERAKVAYKFAAIGKDKIGKEYKSNVKKLPMLIKTNGLGSALAFFFSKGKNKEDSPHFIISKQIHEWLLHESNKNIFPSDSKDLIESIIKMDSIQYRATTNEVISFLNWLKRFADGMIGE